jgi:hypothetical protein
MSSKFSSVPACLLAGAAACAAAAGACSSSTNPGFDGGGGGGSSSSSGGFGSTSSSSSSGGNFGSSSSSSGGGGFGSSSSSSSSGGFGSTSSSSSSGGFGSTSSSSGAGSSSGTTTSAIQCAPTTATSPTPAATGGLAFSPSNYLPAAETSLGAGGYAYPFSDGTLSPPGPSVSCLNGSSFCTAGTVGPANASFSFYGGGVGVNLNQQPGAIGPAPTYTVPATKRGISYTLSSFPTPARLIIDNSGQDYCFNMTAATAMVPWSSFTPQCYNLPGGDAGASLGSAPAAATHVQFQVNTTLAAASSFNFCVTALAFY